VTESLFDVKGKVVFVTGGSRGIGFMIAKAYVKSGARVYVCSRNSVVCDEAASELGKFGECESLPADLSQVSEIQRVCSALMTREAGLDVLVNNAGATWGSSLPSFPEKGWDKVMSLNLKSPFFLIQNFLEMLSAKATESDPSRVINIGSVDGIRTPMWDNYSYSVSKAGLHHLTKTLAAPLAKRHININAIAPGPFITDMMAPMIESMGEAQISEKVLLKRLGVYEDMAGVAVFFGARASAYITGTVLPVDGGMTAAV
jgi:NAD(P)-dependent dehydrogenase (short-subunit alcohol dehydrogenase family)